MREKVIERLEKGRVVAIARGMEEELILPLAEALIAGGIGMMEVTFDQRDPESFSGTARAIESVRMRFGDDLLAGAGTVVSVEQAVIAADAGAMYLISPNVDTDVIAKTRELGLVSIPGAMTPSEAQEAHNAGADYIKLFPAGALGHAYLGAIRAPLSHLSFLAVGGIDEKNMPDFRKAGAVGFGVGGNLVNKDWVVSGRFADITALAKRLVFAAQ